MDFMFSLLAFIVAISVLVAVHEFGHFWVARKLGFKVLRFSIGFGKPLWRWRGKDPDRVEYWISSLPLGGYVKMLDEREGPVDDAERGRAFNRRPVPHRIAVLLAGPGFNFLFAIAAYWLMFVTGVPSVRAIVDDVAPGSVAAEAGLAPGELIESVGGRPTETLEDTVLAVFDEMLGDGRIDLGVRALDGNAPRTVELDVRGRVSELTEPDALFSGLGVTLGPGMSLVPAEIDRVDPGSPAERSGLLPGDRIVAAAGERVRSWQQWVELVRARPGETMRARVLRDGREMELELAVGTAEEEGVEVGRIGTWPVGELPENVVEQIRVEQRYGVFAALGEGAQKTWEMTALTVRMIGHMFTGDVSLRSTYGPIGIAGYAGDSAAAGFTAFVSFLAIVSISLGIMNLLPIPLLDGGQIVFQVAEGMKGSPLSERAMAYGQQLGIVFLIALMSLAFYNDLSRLFGA